MDERVSYFLRVDVDDSTEGLEDELTHVEPPGTDLELTFVDLHTRQPMPCSSGDAQIEALTGAVQDRLHHCSRTEMILFRWPWIVGPDDDPHINQIDRWLTRLTSDDGGEPVLGSARQVGVIQHQIGRPPTLRWANPHSWSDKEMSDHARAVELPFPASERRTHGRLHSNRGRDQRAARRLCVRLLALREIEVGGRSRSRYWRTHCRLDSDRESADPIRP